MNPTPIDQQPRPSTLPCTVPVSEVRRQLEQVCAISQVSRPALAGISDLSCNREIDREDVFCLARLIQERVDALAEDCDDWLSDVGSDLEWKKAVALVNMMESSAWHAMDSAPNEPPDVGDLRDLDGALSVLHELLDSLLCSIGGMEDAAPESAPLQ